MSLCRRETGILRSHYFAQESLLWTGSKSGQRLSDSRAWTWISDQEFVNELMIFFVFFFFSLLPEVWI